MSELPPGNLNDISDSLASSMPPISDNIPTGDTPPQKKGRGRPKKTELDKQSASENSKIAYPAAQKQEEKSAPPGMILANTIFSAGVILGGEEWQPTSLEFNTGVSACDRYMLENGITKLPASLEIVSVFGFYAATRFNKPKTKERFSAVKFWIKNKFSRNRGAYGPLPYNGDNNVGQDKSGKTT